MTSDTATIRVQEDYRLFTQRPQAPGGASRIAKPTRGNSMFKHILLPTDGSELSLRAIDTGIELARVLGASVFAYHAMEPFDTVPYFTEMMIFPEDAYEKEVNERAVEFLEEIKRRAEVAHVPWKGLHEYAHRPYEAIMHVAHAQQCDLIVMGSHGRAGLDRLLLGSETNKLLLSTDIPVLVCR